MYIHRDKKGRFAPNRTHPLYRFMVALMLVVLAWATAFSLADDALADTIIYEASESEPTKPQVIEIKGQATPELINKIYKIANQYGVSGDLMYKVIDCETNSTFDPEIRSRATYENGERELSFGISQVHLPSHPKITKQQAKDPDFALNFMAEKFSEGKHELWSCYNQIK